MHTRRQFLAHLARAVAPPCFAIATFTAEVTVPLGHALMGGGIAPAKRIADPLFAKGFVLLSSAKPIVVCLIDWCEIRNEAHTRWREALARVAGTIPQRVLVSSIHQHDAPIADLTAEKLLRDAKAAASVCDLEFHEKAVHRVARAVGVAMKSPSLVTHVSSGSATVDKVASNRRYLDAKGKVVFGRTSATRDEFARKQPEGTIDPLLRVLGFYRGEKPILALSVYATHPMSLYGRGEVSADFPGLARNRRQADLPDCLQLYGSGASGNVTAGKYNDGDPANRSILADRIYRAMVAAWDKAERLPLTRAEFRSVEYRLPPRESKGFAKADLERQLKEEKRPFGKCLAALGLSRRLHDEKGAKLDLPILDFGSTKLLLLPGESYVEYQLYAQKRAAEANVLCLGYGECSTGYVPTEIALKENDSNLGDWCWVAPGAEKILQGAIDRALSR